MRAGPIDPARPDGVLLVLLALVAALGLVLVPARDEGVHADTPAAPVRFVDDRSCAGCHPSEWARWSGSHHAKAMQPADATTVLGDFSGVTFHNRAETARFFRRNGKFVVRTRGADGRPADFEIAYTFGIDPLQQYLVAFPGGRLQTLTIAWDTRRRRWFSLAPDRPIALDDPLRWTNRYQNWNLMCAECHTTNLQKGYDPARDVYHTTWDAPNVGCQACHGPGERHVAWASAGAAGASGGDTGLVVDFKNHDGRYEVDQCARCHSRRVALRPEERMGRPFMDEFRPEVLRADLYHADGQQRGEVFEYGSFLESRMYARGVRCTDCHDPHSAKPRRPGNALCTRCHGSEPDARFPQAASTVYDSPAHHVHRPGSPGALCVSCHMPTRTYMVVDPRRDHSFPVPRPDLSAKLGTPNACTSCHRRRNAAWAAAVIEEWYGGERRAGTGDAALAIAAARAGSPNDAALIALADDGARPAIVRATALTLLHRLDASSIGALARATGDADPIVRASALSALGRAPLADRLRIARPLLADPIRAVRIEAARAITGAPATALDDADRDRYRRALAELRESERTMADMPSARLTLGALEEDLGHRDLAEQAYLAAVRMDPYLVAARTYLAALYDRAGRTADAERVLREGVRKSPASGELHYALGLLLAEERRPEDARVELAVASRLLPRRARVHYNYALALRDTGRGSQALVELLRAETLDRDDPTIVVALATMYLERRDLPPALLYAERAAALAPDDPAARALLERVRRAMGRGRDSR